MADKLFTLHIVILNHPAALPDAAEQPLVTGRNEHMAATDLSETVQPMSLRASLSQCRTPSGSDNERFSAEALQRRIIRRKVVGPAGDQADGAMDRLRVTVEGALRTIGAASFAKDVAVVPLLKGYAYLLAQAQREVSHQLPNEQLVEDSMGILQVRVRALAEIYKMSDTKH